MTMQHRLPLAAFVLVAALCGTFVMNGWSPPSSPVPLAADRADSSPSATPAVLPPTHLVLLEGSPAATSAPAAASASASEEADQRSDRKKRKKGKNQDEQEPGSVLVRPGSGSDDDVDPSPTESPSPSEEPSDQSGDAPPAEADPTDETQESFSP